MSFPSVCVVIAARDAATTIRLAVTSALEQEPVSEVIVVDDGSSDRTAEAARQAAEGSDRMHVISFSRNRGPSSARNAAIDTTRCDFVCILDADDFMLPGRIAQMLPFTVNADLVADDLFYTDQPGGEIRERGLLGLNPPDTRSLSLAEFISSNVPQRGRVRRELGFLKPLISTSFLRDKGLRYREQLRLGEDFALYAEALYRGARFSLVPAAGYVSVERHDSLSARHTVDDLAALFAFDEELLCRALNPDERQALVAHRADLFCRLSLRRMIEAKADKRYIDAFGQFFATRQSAVYIAREILKITLERLRSRLPFPSATRA